jgi:hypothetical protein
MMADDENVGSSLSSFSKTKKGKTTLIVVGLVVLYLAYKYFRGSSGSTTASAPAVTDSTGQAATGTSGTSGGSVTSGGTDVTGTTTLSPSEQLSQWFSTVEGKAVASNPGQAAAIDATLADLQNNVPLTTQEQQTWQSILGSYGAPPYAVGGQQDVYTPPSPQQYVYANSVDKQILLDAGVPLSQLLPLGSSNIGNNATYVGAAGNNAPAGANVVEGTDRYATANMVDNLLGVTTAGNSLGKNQNSPSNSNLLQQTPAPVPAPSGPAFNPNAVPTKVGQGYVDPNANVEGYNHLPTFNGLTPGTALYYEPTPGQYVHISSPAALQKLAPGTPIYTANH